MEVSTCFLRDASGVAQRRSIISSRTAYRPDGPPACYAGGRGFEARRSRKNPCKWTYSFVGSDGESGPTTQTLLPKRPEATQPHPQYPSSSRRSSSSSWVEGGVATTRNDRRSRPRHPSPPIQDEPPLRLEATAGGIEDAAEKREGRDHDARDERTERCPTPSQTPVLSRLHRFLVQISAERQGRPSRPT